MEMNQYTLFVLLSPFGCGIAIAVVIYSLRYSNVRAARPLAYAVSGVTAYLLFNTLELVDPTPQGTLFFAQVCYLCIGFLTVNWLAFAVAYSNHENWIKSIPFRLLWVIPSITAVLVFTNSYHHLIWRDYAFVPVANGFLYMRVIAYGGWFWVFWLQAYMLILVAAAILVNASITAHRHFRMQSSLAVIAALLPLVVNLIYVLHLIPGLKKDFSSLSYAFSGLLLAVSLFRYRMFDLTPIARANLIENMNDCMFTLDASKRVVDFNPAAQRIFSNTDITPPRVGEPFPVFDSYLQKLETDSTIDLLQAEITIPMHGEDIYFDLQIRRLRDRRNVEAVGYMALMHAITEHKKELHTVRKLADEDMLTGVLSRSRFFELARQEMEGVHTDSPRFSIMMIDIDHFKKINDSLGHIAGDQILQAFIRRMRLSLRSIDLIGRIGGDEFVVLLPGTSLENALQLAERLCAQVAEKPMGTKDCGEIPLTISIGVSEYPVEGLTTLEAIIDMADKGLYQAKAQGRNRACVYRLEFGA
jgi:diguanylate cyclase (GGDEF)-like protein